MEKTYKYALLFFFLVILYLSYLIARPFLISIVTSIILTYIFYPVYRKINEKLRNNALSSLITILLILILIITPILFSANILVKESVYLYKTGQINTVADFLMKYIENPEIVKYTSLLTEKLTMIISSEIASIIIKLPSTILHILIILFIMFYLFKEGEIIIKSIESLIPIQEHHKKELIDKFHLVTKAIIYGSFITAIIQGILSTAIFYILDVPNPFLFGLLTIILSIVPMGAVFVWLPVSIYLITTSKIIEGIILLIFGVLVISTIDNIIKPLFLQKKAKVHVITSVIGLIGGIKLFGFIGIVLGPLILSFLYIFMKIYGGKDEA